MCKTTPNRFIAYYRVSTVRQGQSGLGLEAQRAAVADYMTSRAAVLAEEYTEIESGKHARRPQLSAALIACRLTGAVLVIAKLDRLSRDAHFLLGLEKAGVEFVAADMPNANRLTVGIMAVIAQEEREMISARTKAALAAAKARGQVLGGYRGGPHIDGALGVAAKRIIADDYAREVGPIAAAIRRAPNGTESSYAAVADALNQRAIRTPRGTGIWTPIGAHRLIRRYTALAR
jgi:DNA invertase Pin-like site-specific DNA recombinase